MSAECKRSERTCAAFEKAAAAARKVRAKLEPLERDAVEAIVELQVELMVARDGPNDPLYEGDEARGVPPGALHKSNYKGKTERRLMDLNAEKSRRGGLLSIHTVYQ